MTDIVVPTEQEGTKAVIKTWLKKVGDVVRIDDPVVELETDKVAVEIAATSAGTLSEILIEEGAEVEPGTVLGRVSEGGATSGEKAMAQGAGIPSPNRQHQQPQSPTSDAASLPPGIRKMLADNNLDARDVPMSGARLTREDIQAELDRRAKAPVAGVTRVPHDTMRKRIAEHLTHSVTVAPHVTAVFEADFSAIAAHRAAHKEAFARDGANLTYTPYFVMASVAAMKTAPAVNGRWYDDRIDIYDDVNIGIGTALGEKGLIVPVIHRAQTLSLLEIAKAPTDVTRTRAAGS